MSVENFCGNWDAIVPKIAFSALCIKLIPWSGQRKEVFHTVRNRGSRVNSLQVLHDRLNTEL